MPSGLDDPPVLEDEDFVSVDDGGEAVCNDDARAPLHQSFERLLNEAFGFGIERGGGFVENENAGIFKDDAGDGDALPLTAGELHTALAEPCFVTLGKLRNEFVGVSGLGCCEHFLVGRIGTSVADIVGNRA